MKILMLLLCLMVKLFANQGVVGFWKTIDENSGTAQSIIAIYPYNNKYYGRIVATYTDDGRYIKETLETPKARAPGVKGNPFYCGMDIIWNLQQSGSKYVNGKILDPEHGRVYDAEMWNRNGNLVVRGKILFFGRNQVWIAASVGDFPDGRAPDLGSFVPAIPRIR